MAKKTAAKRTAAKAAPRQEKKESGPRVTAGSVLLEQLGLKQVKADAELVKMVRAATGSVKFDGKQLAWYKSQFRAGKLKGQNGKPGHPIAQGSPLKKRAAKKAAAAEEEEEPIEG